MFRLSLLTGALLSLAHLATSQRTYDSTACNNSPALCDLPYSNVTYLGTHNSPFLRDKSTGFSDSGNQFFNVTVQLDSGVRLLTTQVHLEKGEARLCHSSCTLLDAGPIQDWLGEISRWMDRNPSEVVTLLLVNADNIPAPTLATHFVSTNLMSRTYAPTSRLTWPTLSEMISAKKNLVVFITGGFSDQVPTFMDQFLYVFETPFETLSTTAWSCTLDRPSSYAGNLDGAIEDGMLPLANRFVYRDAGLGILAPNVAGVKDANSFGTLGASLQACVKGVWGGRKPSFVMVDFWSEGDTVAVVDSLNGVERAVNRVAPPSGEEMEREGSENLAVGRGEMGRAMVGMVVAVVAAVGMF